MFRMLIHPSSGACDLFVELFHGLYSSGSMCVGVILWFGWGGVVSGLGQPNPVHIPTSRLLESHNNIIHPSTPRSPHWSPYLRLWWWFGCGGVVSVCRLRHQRFSLHTDTTPPQPNHNVTPTHIEPYQYNPWNNSTNKSQAPEDGCINIWNIILMGVIPVVLCTIVQ